MAWGASPRSETPTAWGTQGRLVPCSAAEDTDMRGKNMEPRPHPQQAAGPDVSPANSMTSAQHAGKGVGRLPACGDRRKGAISTPKKTRGTSPPPPPWPSPLTVGSEETLSLRPRERHPPARALAASATRACRRYRCAPSPTSRVPGTQKAPWLCAAPACLVSGQGGAAVGGRRPPPAGSGQERPT